MATMLTPNAPSHSRSPQVPRKTPAPETLWSERSLTAALAAASPAALPAETKVMRLSAAVRKHLPVAFSDIAWDKDDAPGCTTLLNTKL